MNNGQHLARARHLEDVANGAKRYILAEILDMTNAVTTELENISGGANYDDFTGATSITGGASGLVPAPSIGDEDKFLRGDGTWATVSSDEYSLPTANATQKGGVIIGDGLAMDGDTLSVTISGGVSYADFTGATSSVTGGTNGLVPAPNGGDQTKFLRGDGTWATPATSVAPGVILNTVVSGVEGGLWREFINDTPVLKLRHGDYEYSFAYDNVAYLGGGSSTLTTVSPDTYILGTASVSSEGGLWYDNSGTPKLNFHSGSFVYSLNYDLLTYKGGNANLVSYLPFDSSTTADACGNTWTTVGNVALDQTIKKFGAASLHCTKMSYIEATNVFDPSITRWTFDCWLYMQDKRSVQFLKIGTVPDVTSGLGWYHDEVCFAANETWGERNSDILKALALESWHHIAIVKDATQFYFFTNGQLQWQVEIQSNDVTWGNQFVLGCDTSANAASASFYIDNVRFFAGQALWTSNFTPPTAADYF